MMYGFSVSPQGEVYLCDCLDYSAQRGYIRNYKKDGSIRIFESVSILAKCISPN